MVGKRTAKRIVILYVILLLASAALSQVQYVTPGSLIAFVSLPAAWIAACAAAGLIATLIFFPRAAAKRRFSAYVPALIVFLILSALWFVVPWFGNGVEYLTGWEQRHIFAALPYERAVQAGYVLAFIAPAHALTLALMLVAAPVAAIAATIRARR